MQQPLSNATAAVFPFALELPRAGTVVPAVTIDGRLHRRTNQRQAKGEVWVYIAAAVVTGDWVSCPMQVAKNNKLSEP